MYKEIIQRKITVVGVEIILYGTSKETCFMFVLKSLLTLSASEKLRKKE